MLVSPITFANAMERHWVDGLGNATSKNLLAIWQTMASTFGSTIYDFDKPSGRTWKVLQPPTGTGKSQGLALYCAMHARETNRQRGRVDHSGRACHSAPEIDLPGILIVTRLICQADELVSTINRHAGFEAAKAKHGEAALSVEEMMSAQILVITHAAYLNALDVPSVESG